MLVSLGLSGDLAESPRLSRPAPLGLLAPEAEPLADSGPPPRPGPTAGSDCPFKPGPLTRSGSPDSLGPPSALSGKAGPSLSSSNITSKVAVGDS